jgi:hypothetical protein
VWAWRWLLLYNEFQARRWTFRQVLQLDGWFSQGKLVCRNSGMQLNACEFQPAHLNRLIARFLEIHVSFNHLVVMQPKHRSD